MVSQFLPFDFSASFVVHAVINVVPTPNSSSLLIFSVAVDSLHHNVIVLWISSVVVVDVVLEGVAENPPLKNLHVMLEPKKHLLQQQKSTRQMRSVRRRTQPVMARIRKVVVRAVLSVSPGSVDNGVKCILPYFYLTVLDGAIYIIINLKWL